MTNHNHTLNMINVIPVKMTEDSDEVVWMRRIPMRMDDDVDIQNDIIKPRKADRRRKAGKRRQLDLQRIRDMSSTEGIDPLQLFPKEIWIKLFDEVGPEEKNNAWQVHPMFRDLMESTRFRDILFPLVLKLDAFQDCVKDTDKNLQFARLRCISKSIMKSIDHSADEKLVNSIEEEKSSGYFLCLHVTDRDHRRTLQRLLSTYKKDQPNPAKVFCCRTLSIAFNDLFEDGDNIQRIFDEFKSNVISLMKLIGDQIWRFRYTFYDIESIEESYPQAYALFQHLVSHMPNLKWLEVDLGVFLGEEELSDLFCRQYPFPNLASLERLSFRSPIRRISKTVLRANQHVKMLDLHEEFHNGDIGNLPQLIRPLKLWSFKDSVYTNKCLEDITRIVNFNWKLRTIQLGLDYTAFGTSSSVISLLEFLGWFPTLETVILKELTGFKFQPSDKFKYLKLPKLKYLELEFINPEIQAKGNSHFFFSLQFLLHCTKLETLKWEMHGIQDEELQNYLKKTENGNMIDFRGGLRNLYQSNIWDVFPSLDKVEVYICKHEENSPTRFTCKHDYHRIMLTDKNKSYVEFMKSHGCKSNNNLQHCVLHE